MSANGDQRMIILLQYADEQRIYSPSHEDLKQDKSKQWQSGRVDNDLVTIIDHTWSDMGKAEGTKLYSNTHAQTFPSFKKSDVQLFFGSNVTFCFDCFKLDFLLVNINNATHITVSHSCKCPMLSRLLGSLRVSYLLSSTSHFWLQKSNTVMA